MLNAKVNGISVEVPPGSTIIQACKAANVFIPTLCHHPDIPPAGKCGICVVKVNGSQFLLSCSTRVTDGMVIETNTPEVKGKALDALNKFNDMSMMPNSSEIEEVWKYFYPKNTKRGRAQEKTNALSFDPKLCVNCDRCVRQCAEVQQIGALDEASHSLSQNECISCGQCTTVCPTNALVENSSIPEVLRAMAHGKTVILQTAPAVRVSTGECFGDPVGTVVTGKIVAAAREMGFKYVFDTNFAADLTILEEGTELIGRIVNKGVMPMFTSCCPAWINFVEKIHPEIIPHLSTAKSPHMMAGRVIKTYFAEKKNIDPSNIFVVSLMPCTAKKDEIKRKQMVGDVDAVLTVREYGDMVKSFGIDWASLKDAPFDQLLGESTGAAALFAVTGGVMEAAVRYAHEELTKTKLGKVEYRMVRGFKGVKTATAIIAGVELKIAVCNGIANARQFIESGDYKSYHFIEVMACPCGCIAGGGQPKLKSRNDAVRRADAVYSIDQQMTNKVTSNDNQELRDVYASFLGKPNSEKAHHLLHTHYEMQTTPILEMKRKMETMPIVAYGSASGNASKLGRTLAGYIGTSPIALNMCGLQKIVKQGTAIILCSTFGDGEFPSNAEKFAEQLKECTEDLSGLRFAVCALGSRDYPKFCVAGHSIDKLLVEKGAKRLLPVIELDASSADKGEGEFEKWAPQIITMLGLRMPEISIESAYKLSLTENEEDPIHNKSMKPLGYQWGVMLSSTVLTPQGYEPSMHRYQVKLPVGMSYEAGDHVSILPRNDPEQVEQVIKLLKLNPKGIIQVQTSLPECYNSIPERVTVQELFSQYLDLNGRPNRALIRAFKQYTSDTFVKERLSRILDPADTQYFDDLMKDISVSEFIFEFGKGGYPPLDILTTAIPQVQPRLYSIASAPSGTSRSIDLVITDNIFGPGNTRRGLCTSFLRRFGLTRLAIKTQKGCFGYPDDPTAPIIMAALGCGVAPMLSLLQHRENLKKPIGDASLFFGCRFRNTYPILDSMLENYKDTGAMQDLYVAYSRDGTTKTYITDLMQMNPEVVWKYWSNPKTEFFYCGPARGIPDQLHSILVGISMEKGGMTREQAEEFTNAHRHHIEAF